MANDTISAKSTSSDSLHSATSFFTLGSELFQEVQQIIGRSKVRALRFTLGGRTLKDVPVTPATAFATICLVVAAVVISNLRVEVLKDNSLETTTPNSPAPGGAS